MEKPKLPKLSWVVVFVIIIMTIFTYIVRPVNVTIECFGCISAPASTSTESKKVETVKTEESSDTKGPSKPPLVVNNSGCGDIDLPKAPLDPPEIPEHLASDAQKHIVALQHQINVQKTILEEYRKRVEIAITDHNLHCK